MISINASLSIYKNSALIYEGQPPDDLNIELFYTEDAMFHIESSVSLTGVNKVTIVGELDGSPVTEIITCLGFVMEGSQLFDYIESISFSFEDTTNIKITSITSNGDDNKSKSLYYTNVAARVRELKWSKSLEEQGIIFDKSRIAYIPLLVALDYSNIIEYLDQEYSIMSIVRGTQNQEVIITRIDD